MAQEERNYRTLRFTFRGFLDDKDAQYVYGILQKRKRFKGQYIAKTTWYYKDFLSKPDNLEYIRPALRTLRMMEHLRRKYDIRDKDRLQHILENRAPLNLEPEEVDLSKMAAETMVSFNAHNDRADEMWRYLNAMNTKNRADYIIRAIKFYIDEGRDELEFEKNCTQYLSELANEYSAAKDEGRSIRCLDLMYGVLESAKIVISQISPVDAALSHERTSLASDIVEFMFSEREDLTDESDE